MIRKAEERRKKIRLLTCVLAVLLISLTGAYQVQAAQAGDEQTGTIEVALKDLKSESSSREKVRVDLYRVGTVDAHGKPVFDEIYEIDSYPQDTVSADRAIEILCKKVSGKADLSGITDRHGGMTLSGVERGIYLVRIPEGNPYGKVTPFLVHLPYYEEVNGVMEGPMYEIKVEPKASPNEPEKPGGGKKPSGGSSDSTPVSEAVAAPAVKTGDTAPINVYIGLIAAALLGMGFWYTGIRRNRKQKIKEGKSREKA